VVGHRVRGFAVPRFVGNSRGDDAEEWAWMDVLLWHLSPDLLDHRSHHATNASQGGLEGAGGRGRLDDLDREVVAQASLLVAPTASDAEAHIERWQTGIWMLFGIAEFLVAEAFRCTVR
jgi:hypothetical protein